ncbi:deoxyguanosinetriphosphate triphosphohydrolase [Rhizorhabdus dicambivorans]|uniref:Deoxyguanosinetriphosphate triphosphohydrolase-like protein n=1 Tax=Rhizorhabdus dicambivorans TaxID=1850238 RepID=A0A2A4G0A0_9SPHN|nr:deoxyguanosinetriphosphate triphosphohydrolase [Rhizorhabdus dicambivorans]ATE66628.1 deoxyguanosinetriphosphate triphosphohydrolase [Rhizorhabdus dicambivorans]PCE43888.1 deoxyguanosinetriphosphate triphosphohydrolase [Rhizorhabdus dicambivorans]
MTLAPYASDPARSRGRFHSSGGGETRGPRDDFQRDRDRIIHSISFRRLRHKTQVFVAPDGDHYRVRLTHSLEVAQIGRTIARALGLNEDLTEALCLGHDIGHPPFGHAGEEALEAAMAEAGGFDHNAHTLRMLTRLDSPYPAHEGLNLTWETLEGLAKHNGPVRKRTWAMAEIDGRWPLDLDSWASAEAQVAALADDIAYDNHDIDDGVRAGLLSLDQVLEDPLIRFNWDRVRTRYPDVPQHRLLGELVREQIGCMVNDLLTESRRRLAEAAPRSVEDVRAAGRALIGFSDAMAAREKALTRFMYANLYHHPQQLEIAVRMGEVIAGLAVAYKTEPDLLPERWLETLPAEEPGRTRHIGDFIAGMTDRYALTRYRELVGPIAIEGF